MRVAAFACRFLGCALLLLAASGCEKSREARLRELDSWDPFERWLAAVALAQSPRMPDPRRAQVEQRVYAELVRGLVDPWPRVRQSSLQELARSPNPALAALVAEIRVREQGPLHDTAAIVYAAMGFHAGAPPADSAEGEGIEQRMRAWRDSEFVRALARPGALDRAGQKKLALLLTSNEACNRLFAAVALQAIDPSGSILWSEVARLAQATYPQVRSRVLELALRQWLALEPAARSAQRPLVRAILAQHPHEISAYLAPWALGPDRAAACDAMACLLAVGELAPDERTEALFARDPWCQVIAIDLRSPEPPARLAAALRALRLGALAVPVAASLHEASRDRNPGVRLAARAALARIQSELQRSAAPSAWTVGR